MILEYPFTQGFSTPKVSDIVRGISVSLLEVCLALFFIVTIPIFFTFEGNSLVTYTSIGIIFVTLIARKSFWSRHDIFSKAMLPCFIPGLLFSIFSFPEALSSDWVLAAEVLLLIGLSRWALHCKPSKNTFSYRSMATKFIFFISLQFLYGFGLQTIAPHYLEPLIWTGCPEAFKYDSTKVYPSSTGIIFYYDSYEIAERIEPSLPAVMETLKTSPFFQDEKPMFLVQKSTSAIGELVESLDLSDIVGVQTGIKKENYYFTDSTPSFNCDPTYYSHSDPDRSIVTHELTHRMLSDYYGKWTAISIELWKNEGYAEYMAAQGCYKNKSELLDILAAVEMSDATLGKPFAIASKKKNKLTFNDYIAAMIQTRYALDVKKISPIEFMKRSYKLVSAQEIKDWLMSDDNIQQL